MNFDEELLKIARAMPGIQSAAIMGYDGITVSEYHKNQASQSETIEAMIEYAKIIKECLRVTDSHGLGSTQEVTVKTDKHQFVVRAFNEEYFLCALLSPNAIVGKVKFLMNKKTPEFLKAL